MPEAGIALTLPPQVLIGAGLGLAVSALTEAALEGRSGPAIHGGWTIAARHAGVVLGLLLLTPVFTADLETNARSARLAGTAALLDSELGPLQKIELGNALAERIERAGDRIPDIGPVFAEHPPSPEDRSAQGRLRLELEDQLARAATDAFSTSFLVAAGLALLSLVPVALGRGPVEL
jgi:hypothetical protein